MKKTILTLATVVALGTTSAFAFGGNCQEMQPGQGMMQYGHGEMGGAGMMMNSGRAGMGMMEQLNLTDDQRHKLDVLHSEMKLEMTKLRDPKMMTKMQDLMSSDSFNKKEFIKLQNEMHEKMVAIQADNIEKVFNVLTKEQRTELKTLMNQKPKRPMPMATPSEPAK